MMDGYGTMMDGSGSAWVLLAVLVATAVSLAFAGGWAVARRSASRHGSDQAVELLRRRLATGEIDDEEYLRRRSAIDSG